MKKYLYYHEHKEIPCVNKVSVIEGDYKDDHQNYII